MNRTMRKGDELCQICGEETESLEHTLFFCSNARNVWERAPVQWEGLNDLRRDFWQWFSKIRGASKGHEENQRIQLTINLLWHIWKARNKWIFNAERVDFMDVIHQAQQDWNEVQDVLIEAQQRNTGRTKMNSSQEKWSPPDLGSIKLNKAAIVQKNKKMGSLDIVARDYQGKVVAAWGILNTNVTSLKILEAKGVKQCLIQARKEGWSRIIIETGSKELMGYFSSGSCGDVECENILLDIVDPKSWFYKCSFSFLSKIGNVISHCIASLVIDSGLDRK
ncbi:hypothetical protein ACH5RR_030590 [Cinchona calisaya]|uniref:RNase H type-1 domain-containing protein n=1 Tax=Cinchona calisaya TaxID=153742 RepID=A0ABD2YWE0_9GENT